MYTYIVTKSQAVTSLWKFTIRENEFIKFFEMDFAMVDAHFDFGMDAIWKEK